MGTGGFSHLEVGELVRMGLTTTDPLGPEQLTDDEIILRRFSAPDGRRVSLLRSRLFLSRELEPHVSALMAYMGRPLVVLYAWPSVLGTLDSTAPEAMQYLGPNSAVVNLALVKNHL